MLGEIVARSSRAPALPGCGLKYSTAMSPEKNTQRFLNARGRLPSVKARAVHKSRELSIPLEYAPDYPEASRLFAIEVMRGAPALKDVLSGELKVLVDRKVTLLRRWMAQGRLARRDPHHLIFMIWATTQHYADFSTQVEAITELTLHHPGFFAAARQSILDAVLGPEPG